MFSSFLESGSESTSAASFRGADPKKSQKGNLTLQDDYFI
jgi:hypothetical protein